MMSYFSAWALVLIIFLLIVVWSLIEIIIQNRKDRLLSSKNI